ncbi:hypothetical protein [Amycolatopsis kentuckyensis]|uniref:hypothetical protein n=1 Tax=Amycolatopsis kentuckyensis TaxID=218823 RepID=UPI000A38D80E|nr:hypothetical protein [Amycolatopsis kentuckyensis]
MSNPTLWGSLITGLITGVIALSGVVYTQRRADRRERQQWERERDHERILWEREEAARTFEHRRLGYSTFYELLRSTAKMVYDAGLELGPPLDPDWNFPAYQELLRLELYATPKVRELAHLAYSALWRWGHAVDLEAEEAATTDRADDDAAPATAGSSVIPGLDDDFGSEAFYDGQGVFDEAQQLLLSSMRTDLGVPND